MRGERRKTSKKGEKGCLELKSGERKVVPRQLKSFSVSSLDHEQTILSGFIESQFFLPLLVGQNFGQSQEI